jgi:hypothetical protein
MRDGVCGTATRVRVRAYVRLVARWATICLVGLVMAAFIVFDVLDVDGSTLRGPVRRDALTAAPLAFDTERLLSGTGDPSSDAGVQRIPTLRSPFLDPVVVRSTVTPPMLRALRRIVHPHASRDDGPRVAGPSPTDPA